MNSPKVTVIIPCYNSERYIAETINSVLSQNFVDYKIIAINDGSTARTAAILNEYADRITVLSHEDKGNHGQAAALNLGLIHTESEYVAFLDNDDLWHPDKLQKVVEILDLYKDVGLVYTNGYVIDSEGKVLYTLFDNTHCESNKMGSILLDCYIRTPSLVMVRRSCLQAVGPFTIGIIPDQDMWVRIKELTHFYYLNELLVSYRQHSGQVSLTQNLKMWKDALWVLHEAMKRYPYSVKIKKRRLAVLHYRFGKYGIQTKKYGSAFGHFMLACCYDPIRACKNLLEFRLR